MSSRQQYSGKSARLEGEMQVDRVDLAQGSQVHLRPFLQIAGAVDQLHFLRLGHLAVQRAGNGQEEEVSGLEGTARQACAMHGGLHGGLHVVHEHSLGGAGGIDRGNLDLDGVLRHQRRGRVMEGRIGIGFQVAPVLVVDGEPGRLPVCRGIGILARARAKPPRKFSASSRLAKWYTGPMEMLLAKATVSLPPSKKASTKSSH